MLQNDTLWLDLLLDLRRKPVGIKFLLTEADYALSQTAISPAGMPYCTAVKWAGQGRSYKMDVSHCGCFAASRALGMAAVTEDAVSGSRHAKLGVYENLGVSRSVAREMVYCVHKCSGVEIMPLEQYVNSKPDVVILVTTPYNAMRILQGYAYHSGQLSSIKMAGMCAICQECTSYPYERNLPNVSMLCSGTRCVAQWSKDELGIGIPYHYMGQILDGLRKTVNPMEPNKDKERIAQRLADAGQKEALEIVFNHNYYTGAYGTPEQIARRDRR
ncbi:MAG: DUF169 domain-containing protein [Negativicutes bacterium]|nr:DUF169 domain-containing protein [Negativicutes bacterium]